MQTSGERTLTREDTSPLRVGERFLKHQCLHQQGALQTLRGTDLVAGAPVVVKTAPLHALKVGAFERRAPLAADPSAPPSTTCSRVTGPRDDRAKSSLGFRSGGALRSAPKVLEGA